MKRVLACLALAAAAVPADAALVTLSFDQANSCAPAGDLNGAPGTCVPGSAISPTYGSTAELQVGYRNYNQPETSFGTFLTYSAVGAAFATGSNGGPEPTDFLFTPAAGFEVAFRSLEIFKVPPGGGTLATTLTLFQGAQQIAQQNAVTNTNSDASNPTNTVLATFDSAFSAGPLRLRSLAPASLRYDNLIAEVRAIPTITPVPEPAAWTMLIAGFGLVGGAFRRRARPAAA